jgi:hypothetical protein
LITGPKKSFIYAGLQPLWRVQVPPPALSNPLFMRVLKIGLITFDYYFDYFFTKIRENMITKEGNRLWIVSKTSKNEYEMCANSKC